MGLESWGLIAGLSVPIVTLFGLLWNSTRLPGTYRKVREVSAALGQAKDDPEARAALSSLLVKLVETAQDRESRPSRWRGNMLKVTFLLYVVAFSAFGYSRVLERGTLAADQANVVFFWVFLTAFGTGWLLIIFSLFSHFSLGSSSRAKRASRIHARDEAVEEHANNDDESFEPTAPGASRRSGRTKRG